MVTTTKGPGYVEIDGDGVMLDHPAHIQTIVLWAADADADVILYDNASAASGNKIITLSAKAGYAQPVCFPINGCRVQNGVYADLTGTGALVYVYF